MVGVQIITSGANSTEPRRPESQRICIKDDDDRLFCMKNWQQTLLETRLRRLRYLGRSHRLVIEKRKGDSRCHSLLCSGFFSFTATTACLSQRQCETQRLAVIIAARQPRIFVPIVILVSHTAVASKRSRRIPPSAPSLLSSFADGKNPYVDLSRPGCWKLQGNSRRCERRIAANGCESIDFRTRAADFVDTAHVRPGRRPAELCSEKRTDDKTPGGFWVVSGEKDRNTSRGCVLWCVVRQSPSSPPFRAGRRRARCVTADRP